MATLTVQTISHTGLEVAPVAAAGGGDDFANDGRTMLYVVNGDASPHTVTIDSKVTCNFGSDHDVAVTVPAGESRWIGPFAPSRFNGADGLVDVSYDGVTSVTVAAVKLAQAS